MAVGSAGLYAMSPAGAKAVRKTSVSAQHLAVLDGIGVDAIRRVADERMREGRKDRSTAVVLPCSCGHVLLARSKR
jgi:hypothetical protein